MSDHHSITATQLPQHHSYPSQHLLVLLLRLSDEGSTLQEEGRESSRTACNTKHGCAKTMDGFLCVHCHKLGFRMPTQRLHHLWQLAYPCPMRRRRPLGAWWPW
jgi:hypothetical protein